jgi:hypothetical protein
MLTLCIGNSAQLRQRCRNGANPMHNTYLSLAAAQLEHPDVRKVTRAFAIPASQLATELRCIEFNPVPFAILHVEKLRDAATGDRREFLHRLLGNMRKV